MKDLKFGIENIAEGIDKIKSMVGIDGEDNGKSASQQAMIDAIDQNGNCEIDIEDIIIKGLKVPEICVDRAEFLKKELGKKYPENVVQDAIENNPFHAGISKKEIDKLADEVIEYEKYFVSRISAEVTAPAGIASVSTIPADMTLYYGYVLRASQKLMYLYGFPAIDTEEKDESFDKETMNILTICMGVMYNIAGADKALKAMAKAVADGVEKQVLREAITKGVIYPVVKAIAEWLNIKLTKEVFTGVNKKSVPVVGGVLGGSVTYVSFKPCCDELKDCLQNTVLSNPDCKMDDELVIK
ncbi:MAG: hypothetical protein IKU80_06230 [Firmicutes bacterium]|nr:hypothetical protein [Bacillota bacterium]